MADSLLERKDRYLCIRRSFDKNERPVVVEDIKLVNDRDPPPQYYTPITFTRDSREKGTSRRLICFKLAERTAGMPCICDVIFLYKAKRPPQAYTIIGEINGLQMCVKQGTVPAFRSPTANGPADFSENLYHNPGISTKGITSVIKGSSDYGTLGMAAKKSDEKEILDGIPFEINPKYLSNFRNREQPDPLKTLEDFRILTIEEINQQFRYDFYVERTIL